VPNLQKSEWADVTTLSGQSGRRDEESQRAGVREVADECTSAVVVSWPAEVDLTNAPQLCEALRSACRGNPVVVVDMSGTIFSDSSGVGALVHAHQLAKASGGELLAVVASPALTRIFAVMGVDRLFRIFASLPEALLAASKSASESGVSHVSKISG
jgi:anti-anti-sigma factor